MDELRVHERERREQRREWTYRVETEGGRRFPIQLVQDRLREGIQKSLVRERAPNEGEEGRRTRRSERVCPEYDGVKTRNERAEGGLESEQENGERSQSRTGKGEREREERMGGREGEGWEDKRHSRERAISRFVSFRSISPLVTFKFPR